MTSSFKEIRKIDNTRVGIPFVTLLTIAILVVVIVWFLRGGSFRLYASMFFELYHITQLSWLSIILVAVVQNIVFLPFRVLFEKYYLNLKEFEEEIEKTKADDQYFLLNKRIRQGDRSIIFYVINFVFLFIAFISAGRVFLLEFYRTPIAKHWLYNFIPYPDYPLEGVIFHFPFFKITSTVAISWGKIGWVVGIIVLILIGMRLLWRVLRPILTNNKKILDLRIRYNKALYWLSGFTGVLFIAVLVLLRHWPTGIAPMTLTADLSLQNTTFNLITGIASFLVTIYSGIQHKNEKASYARKMGISEDIIDRVGKESMRTSLRNAFLLGFSAFWVTRLMPCSHDLSVMAFETLYVLSPVTVDLLIPKSKDR
ncbi:MAG: hypothetical protein WC784_02570 [Candidatus Shapirobacteria bacterium]|jgi:predicted permease